MLCTTMPVRPGSASVSFSPGLVRHRVLGTGRQRSTPRLLPRERSLLEDVLAEARALAHPASFAAVSYVPTFANRSALALKVR